MCPTPQALIAFLTLLPAEIVETKGATVIIHAQTGDAVWIASDDLWCTDAHERTHSTKVAKAK